MPFCHRLDNTGEGSVYDLLATETSVLRDFNAFSTSLFLNSLSSVGDSSGLLKGWVIPPPDTMRLTFIILAVLTIVVINATGIFSFSISIAIAAPQRVPVPHVATKITP